MLRSLMLAFILLSAPVSAKNWIDLGEYEGKTFAAFEKWDRICRENGLTGLSETFACGARYQTAVTLFYAGWCYGIHGQRSVDFAWHHCQEKSNIPLEMAVAPHH